MTQRRLKRELDELSNYISEDNSIRNLIVDKDNLFEWKLTISTENESHDIQINFPSINLFHLMFVSY